MTLIHAQHRTAPGLTACGINTDTLPAASVRVHADGVGVDCLACRGVEPDIGVDVGAAVALAVAVALVLLGLVAVAAG